MSRQRSMEVISQSEYVTIGELVRLTDVRYSTLKFYTEQGLLPFEQAEQNLTRRYRREESVERIELLRRLREEGEIGGGDQGDVAGLIAPADSPYLPRCGRSALHPGEIYAGLAAPAPTFWALRPKPRPTFSRRESRQRYARNLLVPGPPAKGASPPLIPRPCTLAVLVEGVQGLRHPRGAARQMGLPIAFPLFRKKTAGCPVGSTGRT